MKTKRQLVVLPSKRFSRRLRNRETITQIKSIDTRKSIDQFEQNEFLKLFQLESTSSSSDHSNGSNVDSSINSIGLIGAIHGFSMSPVKARKRTRSGNLKACDQCKFDDMTTHLPEQITSFDEQLYELSVRKNHILRQTHKYLKNKELAVLEVQRYLQQQLDQCKNTNEQLTHSLQILQQQIQALIS